MTGTGAKHVGVIGAGIVGVATALWLLRDGHKVTLVDRAGPGEGTSYGNGGVLASCAMVPVTGPGLIRKAPGMLFDPEQPLFLRWSYLPKLMPWLARYLSNANEADTRRIASAIAGIVGDSLSEHQSLSADTPAARYVVPSDYLYLYRDRAAFEADAFAWDIRRTHGITWEMMGADALRAFDPIFARDITCAVRMGDHGRISDPGAYVKALAAEAERLGAQLVRAEVEDIARDNGRVTGLRAGGETIACDAVVLATGVWSGPLAKKMGLKVPLESERGYHIELWEPSAMPKVPVMVASGKFVATPMEGRLRLAGVVEFGGTDAGPSRAPFDLLRRNLARALPDLRWAREEEWMGHRPAPADSIPVIGAVPGLAGAYTGFGHHHIGLTGGPRTGRLLAQMISGRQPNLDVSVYAPSRFTRQTPAQPGRYSNQGDQR
ncbi:NAD(P)/FAD-dependent oxidoreductase [Pseudaestuariivita atlantica]|uniref:FAD-binding oxidoreductase n=1 Tax=Pseudaestuariivita atlantica TaxID=1317121 RepID=A0A0L1JME4_9RHOB|nr:FAD-dependent oxidoreductase [Pseudaestuariivita atlantica]KNG92573.1 FAD-binding oxidoreductase [Pseudaestuariivita atlantica]